MRGEFTVPLGLIYGFLLVLARVAGTFVFVPLPGVTEAPVSARVVLILAITMALYPLWPAVGGEPSIPQYLGWITVEAVFGLCVGLLVSCMAETLVLFGQVAGLQAGYSFASTIDPSTQADSTILSSLAQTIGSLLFVTLGLHRQVIRIFALSLESHPPGKFTPNPRLAEPVIHAASSVFSTGLRLALPMVALLMMVDITLALLGRLNSQLQLLHLSFPLKMLAALSVLVVVLVLIPSLYEGIARRFLTAAAAIAGT